MYAFTTAWFRGSPNAWKLADPSDARARLLVVRLELIGDDTLGHHLVQTPDGFFTADSWYPTRTAALDGARELFGLSSDAWRAGDRDALPRLELTPFDPARHIRVIERWVRAPHVARWWGVPAATLPEVLERPVGGGDALIVTANSPVGYIRWQGHDRADLDEAGLHEIPIEGTIDIDIAIGERAQLGRGLGPLAIMRVLQRVAADPTLRTATICSSVDNHAALKAYARAGFERVREFDDPVGGRFWLMTFALRRHRGVESASC